MAVSGGQDSLCLAKLLLDLKTKWGWELAIAHCDHRWRSDSAENALFVRNLAQQWQIVYFEQTAEVVVSSEAAAREWRYQILMQIAQQHGYGTIVTGHTASDRAETFLYNLMRGSGADGLQALTWTRSLTATLQLVRPLLSLTRAQTAQFCQTMGLSIWEDSTNQSLQCARNRIRLELIPYLQAHFNPQVEQALNQTAELLQAEVEYLEAQASQLIERAEWNVEGQSCSFNRRTLQTAPIALQRRAARQFLQESLPEAPNFAQIEKLVALISAPHRSQTDPFPGGAIAQVEGDWIRLQSADVMNARN
ncbi:tRNA lysidine(34) synthetase TilS [Leptolyngbya sp. Cla-17]|uniref:tRNA lysidine(34) synthetase TilS n=1 Tax=Leptolyngbya sp. Cla-17 TaxID=2803751 RepID=UPI001FD9B00D|nr:tRNA lysidine(34) synthetase TilS [Leptolyngbya sp. Cla-17]